MSWVGGGMGDKNQKRFKNGNGTSYLQQPGYSLQLLPLWK